MQVFIKSPSGLTTTLTIPPSTSIATVKSLIALQHPAAMPSATARLAFAGRTLDAPEKALRDYHIPPASTLDLSIPVRGGSEEVAAESSPSTSTANALASTLESSAKASTEAGPSTSTSAPAVKLVAKTGGGAKRKGPRCASGGCNKPTQKIIGNCTFCSKDFCGQHRLLESHACAGLEDAKKADKDRNREKLQSERTVMARGLGV